MRSPEISHVIPDGALTKVAIGLGIAAGGAAGAAAFEGVKHLLNRTSDTLHPQGNRNHQSVSGGTEVILISRDSKPKIVFDPSVLRERALI